MSHLHKTNIADLTQSMSMNPGGGPGGTTCVVMPGGGGGGSACVVMPGDR